MLDIGDGLVAGAANPTTGRRTISVQETGASVAVLTNVDDGAVRNHPIVVEAKKAIKEQKDAGREAPSTSSLVARLRSVAAEKAAPAGKANSGANTGGAAGSNEGGTD